MGALIGICGPIGAGKSTLIRALQGEHPEWGVASEIIVPDLARYYADLRARAVDTQLLILRDRVAAYKKVMHSEAQVTLMDRFPHEDAECLSVHVFEEAGVPGWERLHYRAVAVRLLTGLPLPDLVVAIIPDARNLAERVKRRGRPGEERIPEGYLERLAGRYPKWLAFRKWLRLILAPGEPDVSRVAAAIENVVREVNADAEVGDGAEAIPGRVPVAMD